ncbi:putative reverse transcriptase domain-containing protein [Tanacetum coccineum]
MIERRVVEALEDYEANKNCGPIMESGDERGDDNEMTMETIMEIEAIVMGMDWDFLKCQPLIFKGTEGVVGLTRWFEKMETVFYISNCPQKYQVKFQELVLLCTKMVPEEEDRVEKFIGGLPDDIQGNNVARAYTVGNSEKRGYVGPLPYCNKCKLHHEGQCTMKCGNCKRVRHMKRDCKATITTTTQGAPEPNQKVVTCYECGRQGHYRSDCADRSFVSTTFSAFLDVVPSSLAYHTVISYDEKVVRIPYGDEVLEIQGDGCGGGDKSRFSIISCTKTQKYIQKGCQVFLGQVMEKKAKDKSEEKRHEDVPTVWDFPED